MKVDWPKTSTADIPKGEEGGVGGYMMIRLLKISETKSTPPGPNCTLFGELIF